MAVVDKNKLEEEASVLLRFYKIVLTWDYIRLLKESETRNNAKKIGDSLGLKKVKNTYKDVDEYFDTFEPLLFEEVKAQIVQQKDEEQGTEWQHAIIAECSEVNGFQLPMIICIGEVSIRQNDLLLLSTMKFGEGKTLPTTYAFALVEHRQQDKIKLRLYLNGEVDRSNVDDVQTSPRLLNMLRIVSEVQKIVYVLKVCSLSTIVREYVAMRSITSLPFKDLILRAAEVDNTTEDRTWKLSRPLTEFIENNHNKSQLEAIYAGLSRKSFVLIQGPPGTGKTQTILGILSAILHATPARVHNKEKLVGLKRPELTIEEKSNHWLKASPWLTCNNPRDKIMPINGDDGFFPTSGNEMKTEVVKSSRKYRVRVLVCAPSNSALDEIVFRLLKTGIRDENGHEYRPKVVRIGLQPHHSVKSVFMDYLVEQKLASVDSQASDKQKQGGVAKDKDSIRASILDEAAIVFSTLSFSGSALFSKLNRGFDVVIIDEAAQAIEPATLVPLANGCKQVFLVGDPVQLPATVISTVAAGFGYGGSLFERFQMAGYPVQMLKTQYRMNPEIRSFPSREFYHDALEDGPDIEYRTNRDWHKYRCFGPFCFFDIHEGKETKPPGSGSYVNEDEVAFVFALYIKLLSLHEDLKESSRVAIITPYASQKKMFEEKFRSTYGDDSDKFVDINTVDGFQGREKDVAIFSCVRASEDKGIGFVRDFRRMNVGITRAKSSVLVVGSASTLRKEEHWKNLIESAEQRNVLFKVSKPYGEYFSDDNLKLFEVKKQLPEGMEAPTEEMDVSMVTDDILNAVDADQQPEENYWGDGGEEDPYEGGDD